MRSTWELERTPKPDFTAYESEASLGLPNDTMVVILAKARPGEWKSLFQAGEGTSARKERQAEPPPKRAPEAKPRARLGDSPCAFVPRKLVSYLCAYVLNL